MAQRKPHSYIRTHRRKSGLTQHELATILGYKRDAQVCRHERADVTPTFLIALGYEILFRVPLAELFPGVYETVERAIEQRVAQMEEAFQQESGKGPGAEATARKLEWFWARRSAIEL